MSDPTQRATNWYSPRGMPKQGQSCAGFDCAGGLEQTEGLSNKNYKPGWAKRCINISGVISMHQSTSISLVFAQPTSNSIDVKRSFVVNRYIFPSLVSFIDFIIFLLFRNICHETFFHLNAPMVT